MAANNINPDQLEGIIQTLSQRLNMDPEQIKGNLNSGKLGSLTKNIKQSDLERVQQVLSNPEMAKQILESKQAQDILKQFKK